MKHLILLIILTFLISKLFCQCSIKDYEKFVVQNCFNCNISQQDSIVRKNISLSNSKLTKLRKNFYYKLKNQFNGTDIEKKGLSIKYKKIYENLKKSRSGILLFYRFLGKDGNSESNELMAYWFYTDQMIAILLDVQENLFGDI